ncbi:MAG: 50S ribosomal protein L6, partial [Pseudomonadales bacterium]|nr:50S ribosomal protein L6 [Pseudomonadales bacterium]
MSRVANNPVTLPAGVEVKVVDQRVAVKGSKGSLEMDLHSAVGINVEDGVVKFSALNTSKKSRAMSGTVRSLVNNMVQGVTQGFERKL